MQDCVPMAVFPLVAAGFLALAVGDLSGRVVTGPEADSNARRQVGGELPRADVLHRTNMQLQLAPRFGRHRVLLDAQAGHKAFMRETTQNLLVGELRFRHDAGWLPWLGTFVELNGRDRRQANAARNYNSASMDVGMVLGPWGPVSLLLGAGPRGFIFWPDTRFSFAGAGAFGAVVVRPTPQESLSGTMGLDGRVFSGPPSTKILADGSREFDASLHRVDGSAFGEMSLESARALYLRGAWRITANTSNSRGETYLRQRLQLTVGTVLPMGVRVLLDGQLQATRWPEGLGLGERLALQEGDENQSSLGGQLSVPLRFGAWVEAKAIGYTAEFSSARLPFLRVTAFLGLGYRL